MIENIEQFCAELQFQQLVERKLAMNGKIPLGRTKSSQRIPRQVSLAGGQARKIDCWITTGRVKRGRREGVRVECFPARILPSVQVERLASHIRPRASYESVRQLAKISVENVNWRGRSSLDNILSGPATKNHFREGISFRGGHIIGQRYRKRI